MKFCGECPKLEICFLRLASSTLGTPLHTKIGETFKCEQGTPGQVTILQYHSKDDIESLTKRKEHYNNSSTLVAWSSSTGIVMIHQHFHALKILAIFNDTLDGNYFLFDSRYYCRNNLNEYRVGQRRNKNMDE